MNRRHFLKASGVAGLAAAAGCAIRGNSSDDRDRPKIIDCHTHFYDPTRPEGVPWPPPDNSFLYRRILPADYRAERVPAPVAGTVVLEASPWVEDNQWILDLARDDPFIVGFCGNLDPTNDAFAADLARFSANPLFSGIRVSGGRFNEVIRDSESLRRVGLLADRNLQLDLNVGVEVLPEVARLADRIPALRIVIDHLANTTIDPAGPTPEWSAGMAAAARNPNVFAKASGLVEAAGRGTQTSPSDPEFYAPWLDVLWNEFGGQRIIYGSNWPVSALFAPLFTVQSLAANYFATKGDEVLANVLSRNARLAYRWLDR